MTIRLYHQPGLGETVSTGLQPLFTDPYLELVRLLTEAAQLEHTLMLADLRCLFSIKPEYATVRGALGGDDYLERDPQAPPGTAALEGHYSMLDVALEEMQHLDFVNTFMADLHASPCLVPHSFPDVDDIYPFRIPALGLDRQAAAAFMWVEADSCALSLDAACAGRSEPDTDLIRQVRRTLMTGEGHRFPGPGEGGPSHIGSLYHRILELTTQVLPNPPAHLKKADIPWSMHLQQMRWVTQEGEIGHYRFFRDLFTGAAFGGDDQIWVPGNPDYPAMTLHNGTAYPHKPRRTIPDEGTRQLAWLADLHYWVILALLDVRYRRTDQSLGYHAVDVMTLGLFSLGEAIAERGYVVPFDPLGPGYVLGRGERGQYAYAAHLVAETEQQVEALRRAGLLPAAYDSGMLATVAASLAAGGG
jgi:hypothetical protein